MTGTAAVPNSCTLAAVKIPFFSQILNIVHEHKTSDINYMMFRCSCQNFTFFWNLFEFLWILQTPNLPSPVFCFLSGIFCPKRKTLSSWIFHKTNTAILLYMFRLEEIHIWKIFIGTGMTLKPLGTGIGTKPVHLCCGASRRLPHDLGHRPSRPDPGLWAHCQAGVA